MNELIWGRNSFNEAIKNERILCAYTTSDSSYLKDLKTKNIKCKTVSKHELDMMTKYANHQGIVCEIRPYELYSVEEMIKENNGLIIVLDGLKDPHNLGAILRTADSVGADGVIYKKHNSVKLNSTVAKVSSGAIEYVKVAEVINIVNTLKMLKKAGYWVVGTDASATKSYIEQDFNMNTVLIVGSEGEGISRLVREECDFLVSLPMLGHVTSLNASVAAGVMMYQVLANRNSN